MVNGSDVANADLFETVRKLANGKTKLPQALKDQFMFAAISDQRVTITRIAAKLDKIWPIYQALALFGMLAIPLTVAVVMLFVTGKLNIIRGP